MFKFVSLLAFITLCSAAVDIDKLVSEMTVEEKCGQMTQVTFDVIQNERNDSQEFTNENRVNLTKLEEAIQKYKVGSILNTPYNQAQSAEVWQIMIRSIQDEALKSRHKIPILYGIDSIHGATYIREGTLMPQPLAMASSFNLDIAERVGAITAMETKAVGIPWNFNPVFDVARNPLWPRCYETYGEDQFLSAKMGTAYIKGSQGNSVKNDTKLATCLKHYVGYSVPINGRDRSTAWIPEIVLREYFLPPFAAGVKAGAMTVMINSGDVNGIPGHANKQYMTDILKGEMGFEGFTVSDWEDVKRIHNRDNIAETPKEAVRIAVMAGLDMSMVPLDYSFHDYCVELANEDTAFSDRVNEANKRILKVKEFTGLFDGENEHVIKPDAALRNNINTDSSKDFNLEAASESVILAKNNDNTLPLPKTGKKILVTGPTANKLRVLNGGWSYDWQGEYEQNFQKYGDKKYTVYEALKNRGETNDITLFDIPDFDKNPDYSDIINALNNNTYDTIVLCIGEKTYTEFLGNIDSLMIEKSQIEFANALASTGKPIVLVYLGGRPRIITDIVEKSNVKSVVVSFLPGNRGGEAISDIIFGNTNPSAKFPITYPKNIHGFTNYDVTPIDSYHKNELFPFGHGLSYTSFEYSNLQLSSNSIEYSETLTVSVDVKNNGSRDGKETVILYLNDNYASISRPLKQVRGFQKVNIKAGETTKVSFDLKYEDFTFINEQLNRVAEVGAFTVYVENLSSNFDLKSIPNSANSVFYRIELMLFAFFISLKKFF